MDDDSKASGAFLRVRVAIEIDKPLRRGVLLGMSKSEDPKWFAVQYERLPFYCYDCGIMGHSEIECSSPVPRNDEGRLPYDVQLRAPEEKKRRVQGFAEAATESYGSGSSSGSRPPRAFHERSDRDRSRTGDGGSCHSSSEPREEEETPEVQSPLKVQPTKSRAGASDGGANRCLDMDIADGERHAARKRKSKASVLTPDLNIPAAVSSAIVPAGLVNSRVHQLGGGSESSADSLEETIKNVNLMSI